LLFASSQFKTEGPCPLGKGKGGMNWQHDHAFCFFWHDENDKRTPPGDRGREEEEVGALLGDFAFCVFGFSVRTLEL